MNSADLDLAAWEACGGQKAWGWACDGLTELHGLAELLGPPVQKFWPPPDEFADGEMFPGPIHGVDDWSKSPF